MNILLIGSAGGSDSSLTEAFAVSGHTLSDTTPERALARIREIAPDVIVLDGAAPWQQGPRLGDHEDTRSVPTLVVHLPATWEPRVLVGLVERVAGR